MTHLSKNWTEEHQRACRRRARYGNVWDTVYEKCAGKCVICHSKENLCIDHIVPVSKGGKSTFENLRILCRSCNTIEGQRGREKDPKYEKKRENMRVWRLKNPGYFTEKSREFRKRNPGYNKENNEKYQQMYINAIVN